MFHPLPKEFEDLGFFWYHAHITKYAWNFLPNAYDHIEKIATNLGMKLYPRDFGRVEQTPLTIAMHVRHGDACPKIRFNLLNHRKCIDFPLYMEKAEEMRRKYGVSRIYLATDDSEVIAATKTYAKDGWKFITQTMDRDIYANQTTFMEDHLRANEYKDETVIRMTWDYLADVALMASCDMMIGTFSSNIERLAFELMVVHKGYIPPYISLDVPWCAHYSRWKNLTWASEDFKLAPFMC